MRHVTTLRQDGVAVVVEYSNIYEEFRVRIVGNPAADYFTTDRADALSSAKLMLQHELKRRQAGACPDGPAVGQNGAVCSPAGNAPGSPTPTQPTRP